MEYFLIFIAAIFVNNIVLSQFLGICPFLGVSKKVDTAGWMGMAVLFVMLIATLVTYPIYYGILVPYKLQFMQTIVYILVIAALVQTVEIILKKSMPALYSALGVFLPLITTNCTILGVAINVINFEYNLAQSTVYATATALGFTLALTLLGLCRELLGAGTAFNMPVYPEQFGALTFVLAPGAFITLAYLSALFNKFIKK